MEELQECAIPVKEEQEHRSKQNAEIEEERDMRLYNEQIKKSDGFDVDSFPRLTSEYCGLHVPYPNPDDNEDIRECTQFAIEEYNKDSPKKYHLVEILKANAEGCMEETFYITFVAEDDDGDSKTFQAAVFDGWDFEKSTPNRVLKRVRIKPDQQSQNI